ncbi:MAG: MarC family protein [Bacteroidetes bacterium]|nr:MarC family protein [Bacteroidota bacterium]MBU1422534.1 MarC family protein [Bacteroidota bacterium]MBU2472046.1 MarC family protein [Bacteroidota bacterium]MBU2635667.1 MarC family protein [Bacteroidota bacterium]
MTPFETFLLAFIPLFVAMDVLGTLPLFIGLTEGITEKRRNRLVIEATLTALAISLIFLGSGKLLFSFLGITENDFRIAGGLVLLVLSINDLLFSSDTARKNPETTVGVVPIGIPLIMGPAALTTILIIVDSYGYVWTITSIALNLLIVWVVFRNADRVLKVLGKAGSRAIAKVASLFLAAIAVMMIRVGVTEILK